MVEKSRSHVLTYVEVHEAHIRAAHTIERGRRGRVIKKIRHGIGRPAQHFMNHLGAGDVANFINRHVHRRGDTTDLKRRRHVGIDERFQTPIKR